MALSKQKKKSRNWAIQPVQQKKKYPVNSNYIRYEGKRDQREALLEWKFLGWVNFKSEFQMFLGLKTERVSSVPRNDE